MLGATAPFEPPESVEPFEGLSVLSVFKPVFLRRSSLKKGIATSQSLLSYPMFLYFSVPSRECTPSLMSKVLVGSRYGDNG